MGTFSVLIEVGDPGGHRFEGMEALVDTGATYTVVPSRTLRALGVTPVGTRRFELADGSISNFEFGQTQVRVDGGQVTTIVVFGGENSRTLLGAYTLEGLALAADPVGRKLIPVPGLLMQATEYPGH